MSPRLADSFSKRRLYIVALSLALMLNVEWVSGQTTLIRFNTIGYLPSRPKKASIAATCTSFLVLRTNDSSIVYSNVVTGPVLNSDSSEQLYTADFSALTEEGTFQLSVPGVGVSAPFRIAGNVYQQAYSTAMLGMYLWRCGTAVSATYNGQTYSHAACHVNDAWQDYVGGGHVNKNSLKGWHDAGDYNKYVANAGVTVGSMFRAWEDFSPQIQNLALNIPEAGGTFPDFLDELKFELDWLLTMQAPNGSVYHKVSTLNFGGFIMPETEITARYFVPWGSTPTADFVAMMAQASRYMRPYDPAYADTCLAAASSSYAFLVANPAYHAADQTGFSTGGYESTDGDDRLWAAAELWEATGSGSVLADLETRVRASTSVNADFDWGNVKNLGMFTYALSERPGRDLSLVNQVRLNLINTANGIVTARNSHGYNRPLGTSYYWGCNGGVARQAVTLVAAYRVSPRPEYLDTALDALSHLLGRNRFGRSFVTGLGYLPPMNPHDRRSGADGIVPPWPGYLVGGANPTSADWFDVEANYQVNEIAINWNAGLIHALAAFANPGQTTATNGWYRLSPALNDAAALSSASAPPASDTPAQEFSWINNHAQRWLIQSVGGGYFRVSPQADTNTVLELQYGAVSNGTPVVINAWDGGVEQQWSVMNNGDGSFRLAPRPNAGAALALANNGVTNGTPLVANAWDASLGQRWYLSGIPSPVSPPDPWKTSDVGAVAAAGNAIYADGAFTASGSGAGIGGTADEFFYTYQLITGDCDIRARVAAIQTPPGSSRGGVMIRDTLNSGSAFASTMMALGASPTFTTRTTVNGTASSSTGSGAVPYWVRLTRSGSTLTAFRSSTNGTTWSQVGSPTTIAMSNVFYVGLAVSSSLDGSLGTVNFDSVSLFITNGNAAPVLSPLNNQVADVGQVVAFNATGTDTNLPPQNLTYSLLNGPPDASLSSSGSFAWRPLVTQANTTNLTVVKVADDGFPSMSATQSCLITVRPLVLPTLASAGLSNGGFTLQVTNSIVGPDYAVQSSTNLLDWSTLFITNSPGLQFVWPDTNADGLGARFYRVKVGPPLP